MKKKIILFLMLFFMIFGIVKAESNYYRFSWDYEWNVDSDLSGFIDTINTDNGYLVVGYKGNEEETEFTGTILYFDSTGKYIKTTETEDVKLVKIIKYDNYYYAFGINGIENKFMVYKLDSTGKILKTLECFARKNINYEDENALYVTMDDNNFYIFDYYYYSWFNFKAFKVSKDLESYTEDYYDNFDESGQTALDRYVDLHSFYLSYIYTRSYDDWENFGITAFIEYEDGFLLAGVDFTNKNSYIFYEEEGTQIWMKTFENVYITALIPYDGHFIATIGDFNEDDAYYVDDVKIVVLDTEGNILENSDLLSNYIEEDGVYPEYLIELDKGFMLASSIDEDTSFAKLTYFSKTYKITTDVGDNGSSNVQLEAIENEKVKIVVNPDNGYVLNEIVVTDQNGNVIQVDDNMEFVMPEGNVNIKITFKEETIEAPPTGKYLPYVILIDLILLCISSYLVSRKNRKFFRV